MTSLKPCPFCRGEAGNRGGCRSQLNGVGCTLCDAHISLDDIDEAIKEWNTRAEPDIINLIKESSLRNKDELINKMLERRVAATDEEKKAALEDFDSIVTHKNCIECEAVTIDGLILKKTYETIRKLLK